MAGSPQQHGCMAVMATGMHLAGHSRGPGLAGCFRDRQRIHVGAQADNLAIVPALAPDDADNAGAPDAGHHFVNAEGPIAEVEANILRELQYQSSLELHSRTFDRLRPLQLADEIVLHARQQLVNRLDSYELEHTDLFIKVVNVIHSKFMPIIQRHALSGRAQVNTEDPLFHNPLALSMLIDIFSERGFHAVVDKHIQDIPNRFDLQTGNIELRQQIIYRVQVNFKGSQIRRG